MIRLLFSKFSTNIFYFEVAGIGVQDPAGKDNIPILQLKWKSGKMKKVATFDPHAYLECHQPFLRSRPKLRIVPARISARSTADIANRVRPDAKL
jgi:hypothetical protein